MRILAYNPNPVDTSLDTVQWLGMFIVLDLERIRVEKVIIINPSLNHKINF